MSTTTLPTYVEDGRACQIVTVAELLPGDVLLGWQGEPWDMGTVERVEKVPQATFGPGPIRHRYVIHFTDRPASEWNRADDYRRIAKRSNADV